MKPRPSALLRFGLAALLASVTPVLAQDAVRKFEAGPGANAVGRAHTGEGSEFDGPQAIYAGRNGEVFLLDQVNSRIISFDGKDSTGPTRSLALPDGIEPSDMIVTDGNIVVWDGKPVALDVRGSGLTRSLTVSRDASAASDETILSMFGQVGAPGVGSTEEALAAATRSIGQGGRDTLTPRAVRKAVATRGAGAVSAVFTPDQARTSMDVSIFSKATQGRIAQLKLRTRDQLGAVELLEIDDLGRAYVLVEVVPGAAGAGQTFVARFAQSAAFEGSYLLPLSPDMSMVRRFVTVSPEGDVYFLRSVKGAVDVIGVGFTPGAVAAAPVQPAPAEKGKGGKGKEKSKAKPKEPEVQYTQPPPGRRAAIEADNVNPRSAIAAVGPLTRQRVIETAFAFEGIRWRVTPSNYGGDPDMSCSGFDRIRRPPYLRGGVGAEVRGVPYCWGCSGSLSQFARRISQGAVAGNVCTRDDPRRELAGVDCSAFVSATWGLTTHFTTAMIPSITTQIDPWSMKPGDALNKPNSHVMLFIGFTPDRRVQVIESATGACNGRVCRNVYTLGSLLERGYTARRYRGLDTDQTAAISIAPPTTEPPSQAAGAGTRAGRGERAGAARGAGRDPSGKARAARAETGGEARGKREATRGGETGARQPPRNDFRAGDQTFRHMMMR